MQGHPAQRQPFLIARAQIAMNKAASAKSNFVTVENQLLANLWLTLTILLVVVILAGMRILPQKNLANSF